MGGADGRAFGARVGQQIAEVAVFAVADRPVEADRVAAHRQHAPGFFDRVLGGSGRLFDRRLAAEPLEKGSRNVAHAAHRFDHVHRNTNRAALVGHGAGDRLANPPGGVGAELKAAAVFKLVDGAHQAGVAFLDQIEEAEARGCDTSWRSTPPNANCLRTDLAWRADSESKFP